MGKIITDHKDIKNHLSGAAMPKIMKGFQERVLGRTIKEAGYLLEYGTVVPILILDDGTYIVASSDDEFNDGGVLRWNPVDSKGGPREEILCQSMPIQEGDIC